MMISPAMPKSRLLLITNDNFCVLRSLRFSICACKRCSEMVSIWASFSLHIDYSPLHCDRKSCRAPAHLTHHLPHAVLAGLCLPPADVCINKPIVPVRTTPFTAAPSRQGWFSSWREASMGTFPGSHAWALGQSCCADLGLPDTSLFCVCFFPWLFNHLLNPVLPPVWAILQPCGNHLALIHAEEGLLSLGWCRSTGARWKVLLAICSSTVKLPCYKYIYSPI